jgi:hypothetical protein
MHSNVYHVLFRGWFITNLSSVLAWPHVLLCSYSSYRHTHIINRYLNTCVLKASLFLEQQMFSASGEFNSINQPLRGFFKGVS